MKGGKSTRPPSGPCPGCGSTVTVPAFVGRDLYLRAVDGEWIYMRCIGCGSVMADPQPSDQELRAAYARSYGPYRDEPGIVERLGEPLARREAARLVAVADPSSLAVDVGCGSGAMIRRLRETGWQGPLRGVEPDPETAAHVARALSVPVDVAPIEALPETVRGAGLIVLRHVIEHVRDPREILRALHDALAPNGLLYLATPDRRALAERVFGRYWPGYDPPRHLYAFTREGVLGLLVDSGFVVVHETWDFAPQFWTGALQLRLASAPRLARASKVASLLNPLVGVPAVLIGLLEFLMRRTTMYGVLARRA